MTQSPRKGGPVCFEMRHSLLAELALRNSCVAFDAWCPGPDSNRHGVSPKVFSYLLQLSLPRRVDAFVVWTLPLP